MEKAYQVIVIGAGPAGSSCGIWLQRQGISNCLIDRAVFPRDKTCGGLVTEKTKRLLDQLFENPKEVEALFSGSTKEVAVFEKTAVLACAETEHAFRFVERRHFDNALVETYKSLGGTLYQGQTSYRIDHDRKEIVLADGSLFGFRYLVFADGSCSQAHRLLPEQPEDRAFGIEAFVPAREYPVRRVGLSFGFLEKGYVWIFPKGERVCIGLGGTYRKGIPYRELLAEVLKALGTDPSSCSFQGAFLPYGKAYPQDGLPGHILLAGDAAGLADPISGEGLYFALLSGKAAADAMKAADPKAVYLQEIAPVQNLLAEGKHLQETFFRPSVQKVFLKTIRGRNGFLKYYLDEHVSFYHYRHSQIRQMMKDYGKRRLKR